MTVPNIGAIGNATLVRRGATLIQEEKFLAAGEKPVGGKVVALRINETNNSSVSR